MRSAHATTHWGIAALMLLLTPAAFSQTMYRCTGDTSTYLSDRPCDNGAKVKANSTPPALPSTPQTYTPTINRGTEILPYMSPECAELNEAIRTGPVRGLKGMAMSDLVTDYRKRCGENEQLAHQKLQQSRSDDRRQRDQAQATQNAVQARTKLSVEQCSEMLGTLATRRKRTATMTPGELSDLELFEANYKARCKSG